MNRGLIEEWVKLLRETPDSLRCRDRFSRDNGQFCAVGLVGYKLLNLRHPMSYIEAASMLDIPREHITRISCLNEQKTFQGMADILQEYLDTGGEGLPDFVIGNLA